MTKYTHLFQPLKVGKTEIKNRIFMPPIFTNLANKGYVTEELIQHYAARAKGGVGLVIEAFTGFKQAVTADSVLAGKAFPGRKIVIIGDGEKVGNLRDAITRAYEVVKNI